MAYYVEHGTRRVPEVIVLDDRGQDVTARSIMDRNGVDMWDGLLEQEGYLRVGAWHPDPHGIGQLRANVARA